jgi:hypothetical protein
MVDEAPAAARTRAPALDRLPRALRRLTSGRWARPAAHVAAVSIAIVFTFSGVRGVDFGYHWDEIDWQVKPVREMVESGLMFPRASIYPSFGKWLILLPALPSGAGAALDDKFEPRKVQAAMVATLAAPSYLLTARRVYVVFSALAIIWIYAAALALRRRAWEAFVAAAALGLSFEYSYHSRWVATDCLAVQFAALTAFMLALYLRRGRTGWLYAAAIAAGMGAGSKYPAVILLVPVLLTSALTRPWRPMRPAVLHLIGLGATAFGAYLVTTPSTVLDPFTFVEQLRWISDHYSRGHYMHTAKSSWHHLALVFEYIALEFFSPYRIGAVVMFAIALFGATAWARASRRVAAIYISLPVGFLLFFCFRYLAMMARNYLLITPFLCLFAARGVSELVRLVRIRLAAAGLVTALGALAVANAVYLVRAGESIRHYDPNRYVEEAITYVAEHPETRFMLSPRVKQAATDRRLRLPPNGDGGKDDAQEVVFFAKAEGPDGFTWMTNDPFLTRAVFGPLEVNFNWYSGWGGQDRVVILTLAKAKETGAPVVN